MHVDRVFGVPGDFTLKALDHLPAAGVRFVGCCNELNAAYAADGYARVRQHQGRGMGALFTTYGVGELSAANAVAGSFAEHVPVVHLVGTPSRKALEASAAGKHVSKKHLQVHHSLGDGRSDVFKEIASKFTAAQLDLAFVSAIDLPASIDGILSQALHFSQPVYINLPSDLTETPVAAERLKLDLYDELEPQDVAQVDRVATFLLQRLYSATMPLLLVDRGLGCGGMRKEINEFAKRTKLPILVMPSGLGMIDPDLPSYLGVHSGQVGKVDTMPLLRSADLVLAMGPMFSDTQTLGWQTVPSYEKLVTMGSRHVDGNNVDTAAVLREMTRRFDTKKVQPYAPVEDVSNEPTHNSQRDEDAITQTEFYERLGQHIQRDDVVLLGNATPILGGRVLPIFPGTQVIASGMWFSIGHMLPAALGASQAHSGRTILLDGDGSFQVTAQELSTIIHQRADAVVFIMNNSGYTYERFIHGWDAEYNDIAPWDYSAAPSLYGKPSGYPIFATRVRTWKDLNDVFNSESFRTGKGLTLVDVVVGKYDIPGKFGDVFEQAGKQL